MDLNKRKRGTKIGVAVAIIIVVVFFTTLFFAIFKGGEGVKGLPFGEKIGVIEIKGIIADSKDILEDLNEFKKDSSIKGIIIRVDSPGGAVGPSQEIYKEIKNIKEIKKVVASMGSVAASGGYYIACSADKIYANPGTITGSIGVIMEFANIEELIKKIGLKLNVVKSGKHKDIGSPVRELTPNEKKLLQDVVDNVHKQFVEDISISRNLNLEDVYKLADGRIFTGEQALKLGLIDNLGNLNDAIKEASKLAGIKGEPVVVYPKSRRFSFFDFFMDKTIFNIVKWFEERYYGVMIKYIYYPYSR